ncbi:Metallo-dependent phosphatase-like protein [Zychaea mexicana]|uniref:Metallo-dependent phosphatase-like protein n=1 Tax=Zychaea mexicana TaxID=64656 RepID=UPI0022FE27BB|nr:Metallo-dependent phosphatase-like protein [Zychaea mexicana]KAI9498234.1 Metallo-dependent phosphatase-like protein [Zychaea mexicana]
MMLHPNSYEPYSSVSFQHKQPTSPHPDAVSDDNKSNTRHREAFLDALMDSRPQVITPTLTKPTSKLRRWRWRRYRQHILFALLGLLLLLYCFQNTIAIYFAFFRIKFDNALFDRGWIPCGVLRKQPMLYVQDTQHIQVVWEMNCPRDMTIAWSKNQLEAQVTEQVVDAVVLDDRHALYKATIGPLDISGQYVYKIETQRPRRLMAKHIFRWHATTREPIRMAAMADNQFGLRTFVSLLRRIKNVDYLLHAGDAVQNYPSLRQWQTDFVGPLTFFRLGQRMPIIYAHGNHDHDPTYEYHYTRVSPSSDPWFAFSMAGGAIRFVVLDSNLDWEQQDTWLKHELASTAFQNAEMRVVVVHVPPFIEYWEPDGWFKKGQSKWGAFVKDRFVPLFEKYGVDLVISGHQHNYERGQRNGIHYTIIGGAGGDLDFERVKDWQMYEARSVEFHYVILEFRPPTMQGRPWELVWDTYDLHGNTIDTMKVYSKSRIPVYEPAEPVLGEGAVAGDTIEELTYNDLLDDNPQLEEENIDDDDIEP